MASELTTSPSTASPEAALLEPAPTQSSWVQASTSGLRMGDPEPYLQQYPSWLRPSAFELRLDKPPELSLQLAPWQAASWGPYGDPFLPPLPPSSPTWVQWLSVEIDATVVLLYAFMDTLQPPALTMDVLSEHFVALSLSEDAVDGSITDTAMKIIKGALACILDRIIEDDMQETCVGCSVKHPCQWRHTCLYEPEPFYFCNNFEKLIKKLYRPWFKYIIMNVVPMFNPNPSPVKVQGTVEAVICELKGEINIREKLRELKCEVEGKDYECAVDDAIHEFCNLYTCEQTLAGV